jgi:hypothetical protein
MLRATIITLVISATFGALAAAAIADDAKCAGTIVKIDGDAVTVKDMTQDAQQHQIKVEPATKIVSGGKPVMASDLKIGQKVKCACQRKDGAMICTSMEILRDTP